MPINVQLWSEARLMGWTDAKSWFEEWVDNGANDFGMPLERAMLANEPLELIKHIDPWGNTVFNYLQMATLIAEFERLSKYVEVQSEQRAIDAMIRAARVCQTEVHHYLVFMGD